MRRERWKWNFDFCFSLACKFVDSLQGVTYSMVCAAQLPVVSPHVSTHAYQNNASQTADDRNQIPSPSPHSTRNPQTSITKSTMNLLIVSSAFITAEAFAPSTNEGRLSLTALNNYARTKWSPGAAAPSTSNFSPFSSFPAGAATSVSSSSVPYDDIRAELKSMMDNPSWDDGSLAPIFIRLAWHSSGTYDAATGTGGSNGAGMRFQNEAADPGNARLEVARAFLEPV